MLSAEARKRLKEQRRALRAFLRAPTDEAYVVRRDDEYCLCSVMRPSLFGQIGLAIRALTSAAISWLPGSFVKVMLCRLMGVKVGRGVYISPGVIIDPFHPWMIEIGDDCSLGLGARLFTHEYTTRAYRAGRVRIGEGSVIGAYSTVRAGVTIGKEVTVGFNSYVNRDVPDDATVGGVPARALKSGDGEA